MELNSKNVCESVFCADAINSKYYGSKFKKCRGRQPNRVILNFDMFYNNYVVEFHSKSASKTILLGPPMVQLPREFKTQSI